ncbi:MAG: hypothetical protein HY848_05350 [Betaproteobacteria bacterium]|nr:hypothetical protein [Betaproteobacteria bacterium]
MRLAFVVEGSHVYHNRTQVDLLDQLWRVELPRAIGCIPPHKVFGINKGSVAAMRLKNTPLRRTTSIAEPLDDILERHRKMHKIDCFVIAWDLVPPWDKEAPTCRWTETLALYEGLSLSNSLNSRFRDFAAARFGEMKQRRQANIRPSAPKLIKGAVLAVCMEPLFESVFMDEDAMRRCLDVRGIRAKGWPTGWTRGNVRATDVIDAAVDAARDATRGEGIFRAIRQSYETLKTEWGIQFVRSRVFDEGLRSHPIGRRLRELRGRLASN